MMLSRGLFWLVAVCLTKNVAAFSPAASVSSPKAISTTSLAERDARTTEEKSERVVDTPFYAQPMNRDQDNVQEVPGELKKLSREVEQSKQQRPDDTVAVLGTVARSLFSGFGKLVSNALLPTEAASSDQIEVRGETEENKLTAGKALRKAELRLAARLAAQRSEEDRLATERIKRAQEQREHERAQLLKEIRESQENDARLREQARLLEENSALAEEVRLMEEAILAEDARVEEEIRMGKQKEEEEARRMQAIVDEKEQILAAKRRLEEESERQQKDLEKRRRAENERLQNEMKITELEDARLAEERAKDGLDELRREMELLRESKRNSEKNARNLLKTQLGLLAKRRAADEVRRNDLRVQEIEKAQLAEESAAVAMEQERREKATIHERSARGLLKTQLDLLIRQRALDKIRQREMLIQETKEDRLAKESVKAAMVKEKKEQATLHERRARGLLKTQLNLLTRQRASDKIRRREMRIQEAEDARLAEASAKAAIEKRRRELSTIHERNARSLLKTQLNLLERQRASDEFKLQRVVADKQAATLQESKLMQDQLGRQLAAATDAFERKEESAATQLNEYLNLNEIDSTSEQTKSTDAARDSSIPDVSQTNDNFGLKELEREIELQAQDLAEGIQDQYRSQEFAKSSAAAEAQEILEAIEAEKLRSSDLVLPDEASQREDDMNQAMGNGAKPQSDSQIESDDIDFGELNLVDDYLRGGVSGVDTLQNVGQSSDIVEEAEDDWKSSFDLAQSSIDDTVASLDYDYTTESTDRSQWEIAQQLAADLAGSSNPPSMDDENMEELAEAARQAVAAFEQQQQIETYAKIAEDAAISESVNTRHPEWSDMTVRQLKDELNLRGLPMSGKKAVLIARLEESEVGTVEERDDLGFLEATGELDLEGNVPNREARAPELFQPSFSNEPEEDMEELARAAREAVQLFESSNGVGVNSEEVQVHLPLRDWSKMTVAQLRNELSGRGLPTVGNKIELIASLEAFDLEELSGSAMAQEDVGSLLEELDIDSLDLEALGKAARDAVLKFETDDEPSDEALWEIENEVESDEPIMLPSEDDSVIDDVAKEASEPQPDYESMAVSQIKEELRVRGLRVTGKKVDLIERLRQSDEQETLSQS